MLLVLKAVSLTGDLLDVQIASLGFCLLRLGLVFSGRLTKILLGVYILRKRGIFGKSLILQLFFQFLVGFLPLCGLLFISLRLCRGLLRRFNRRARILNLLGCHDSSRLQFHYMPKSQGGRIAFSSQICQGGCL